MSLNESYSFDFIILMIESQIKLLCPFSKFSTPNLRMCIPDVYHHTEKQIQSIKTRDNKKLNLTNSWHLAHFYLNLSTSIWKNLGDSETAEALFLLNKTVNGIDAFYKVNLPSQYFLGGHTVGQVLVNMSYPERFVIYQNCTVGRSGEYIPELNEGLVMFPNSNIIGRCCIGKNVVISPGITILNQDIESNTLVTWKNFKVHFQKLEVNYADNYFV